MLGNVQQLGRQARHDQEGEEKRSDRRARESTWQSHGGEGSRLRYQVGDGDQHMGSEDVINQRSGQEKRKKTGDPIARDERMLDDLI